MPRNEGLFSKMRERELSLKPRLLTVKEAASYLGRSIPSIRELIWGGSLPIVRVGRRIHLDLIDLDKWIEAHKIRYTY